MVFGLAKKCEKRIRVGVIVPDTVFFQEILNEFKKKFIVKVFEDYKSIPLDGLFETITKGPLNIYHKLIHRVKLLNLMKWSDVCFFEWAKEDLILATHFPKKCKIVVRLHRYEFFKFAEKIDWNKVHKVMFVAGHMERLLIEKYPILKEKTVVIPSNLDINKFKPKERDFKGRIGILGNIIERKRIYELILAFYEIQKENKELTLHIGGKGKGEYHYQVKDLIRKLELDNKVFLEGYIENIVDWYNSIDIYISNSRHEGLQLSLIEALICGCYPLSHFWNGAEEVLPKNHIYITDNDLKAKIMDYCKWEKDERNAYL